MASYGGIAFVLFCDSIFILFYFLFFAALFFLCMYVCMYVLAALGLRFCARAFSSCGKWGPLFIAVRRRSEERRVRVSSPV